jgi:ribonuclease HII
MKQLLLGIDDAGRGPIIGPMILAGVLLDKDQEAFLKKQGAADSKTLYQSTRVSLSKLIKKSSHGFEILKAFPEEIDAALSSPELNLNKLEAIKAAEIINTLNTKKQNIKVIIDCPSINTVAWKKTLLEYVKTPANLIISCEHKADANHTSVSAASIIAKVAREVEVAKLRKKYGPIGSGYPSDPTTKEFLKNKGKDLANSGIFRKTWSTWKKLYPDKSQSTLSGF